jgi:two-component system nitrate/nitrite response regulator NarL
MPIRLVLADDHPIVLDGLIQLLSLESDMAVVARASNGVEALRAVRGHKPDILVLDLHMPLMDGLAVVRAITHEALPTKIVVLTGYGSDDTVEAVELGVRAVVLKEIAPALLVRAVREVYAGGTWFELGAGPQVVDRLRHHSVAGGELA